MAITHDALPDGRATAPAHDPSLLDPPPQTVIKDAPQATIPERVASAIVKQCGSSPQFCGAI